MKHTKVNYLIVFFLTFIFTVAILIADTWQECLFWLLFALFQLSVIARIRWKLILIFSILLIIPGLSLFLTNYLHLKSNITGSDFKILGLILDEYRFQISLYLTIRALALSFISFSYLTAINYDKLIYSLIQNIHLPVEWGYALLAAFNSVGKMRDDFLHIRQSALMRFSRPPSFFFYLIPLLVSATRYSQQTALSMQTRGLNKSKTFIINQHLNIIDIIILSINVIAIILIINIFNNANIASFIVK